MNRGLLDIESLTRQDIEAILARSKEFPNGSARHGYEFVAPLDAKAHIDPALWRANRAHCGVRRFWGDAEEFGKLVHRPGGSEPSTSRSSGRVLSLVAIAFSTSVSSAALGTRPHRRSNHDATASCEGG